MRKAVGGIALGLGLLAALVVDGKTHALSSNKSDTASPSLAAAVSTCRPLPLKSESKDAYGGTEQAYLLPSGQTTTFFIRPKGVDLASAPRAEQAHYGLIPEPSDPKQRAQWIAQARFQNAPVKLCVGGRPFAPNESQSWAGEIDTVPTASASSVNGSFDQTGFGTACHILADEGSWTGIGGFKPVGGYYRLQQDGTGIYEPGTPTPYIAAWYEALWQNSSVAGDSAGNGPVYNTGYFIPSGDHIETSVIPEGSQTYYYVYDVSHQLVLVSATLPSTGRNNQYNDTESYYDGSNVEWIDEQRPGSDGLAQFYNGTILWLNDGNNFGEDTQTNYYYPGNGQQEYILGSPYAGNIYNGPLTAPLTNVSQYSFTDNWQSCTGTTPNLFAPEALPDGFGLVSPNGAYHLSMQSDGNLCEWTSSNVEVWCTFTGGHPGDWVAMQSDGNLVVWSASNTVLWRSLTGGHPLAEFHLGLNNGGALVIYSPTGAVIWSNGV